MADNRPFWMLRKAERDFFRNELRVARALALSDSEGFLPVIQAIERLGRYLKPNAHGLREMRDAVCALCDQTEMASLPRAWHTPFEELWQAVRHGRNGALHEGAYARHLTRLSVELALLIEKGLGSEMATVGDFMVRTPVVAEPWQPISYARQQMLLHSFSYLPICIDGQWFLLSDLAIAKYLSAHPNNQGTLSRAIGSAYEVGELALERGLALNVEDDKAEVVSKFDGKPGLVFLGDRLVGIVTPFDLL